VKTGMLQDLSWAKSAEAYVRLFEGLVRAGSDA
jgi:glycogen synthase